MIGKTIGPEISTILLLSLVTRTLMETASLILRSSELAEEPMEGAFPPIQKSTPPRKTVTVTLLMTLKKSPPPELVPKLTPRMLTLIPTA